MHIRRPFLFASMLLAAVAIAPAQKPVRTIDINKLGASTSPSSDPHGFVQVDRYVFFVATTSAFGKELYVTDIPSGETELVADIYKGNASSSPGELVQSGFDLLFTATNANSGKELYVIRDVRKRPRSVALVKDLTPTNGRSSNPNGLTYWKGHVYFSAEDETVGSELFRTDGTSQGTMLVRDIAQTPRVSNSSKPAFFTPYNGRLYFSAWEEKSGRELWSTDGTATGTKLAHNLRADSPGAAVSSDPKQLHLHIESTTPSLSSLFFVARGDAGTSHSGYELWELDSKGVRLTKDLNPGTASSSPQQLTSVGKRMYFVAQGVVNGSRTGIELFSIQGGVLVTHDLLPGTGSSLPSHLTAFERFGNPMLALGAMIKDRGREMVLVDHKGFRQVVDVLPGPLGSGAENFVAFNPAAVVFAATGQGTGRELYINDEKGTRLLADINKRTTSSSPRHLAFVRHGTFLNKILFSATDGYRGHELFEWTLLGVRLVAQINTLSHTYDSKPKGFLDVNGVAYFQANDGIHGPELWRSDGTEYGTRMVADLEPAPMRGSSPSSLIQLGNSVLFLAKTSIGEELFAYTPPRVSATSIDIRPGSGSSDVRHMVVFRGKLYFSADDGVHGRELWVSDGTLAGTKVIDLVTGSRGSNPAYLTVMNNRLWFSAVDASGEHELWRSNGKKSGTTKIDIRTGISGSSPAYITRMGDRLIFQAVTTKGVELCSTDGTTSGTKFFDIDPRSGYSGRPRPARTPGHHFSDRFAVVEGNAFFAATTSVGEEPYWFDGAQVRLIKDISPGADSSRVHRITPISSVAANGIVFAASPTLSSRPQPYHFSLWLGQQSLVQLGAIEMGWADMDCVSIGSDVVFTGKTAATGRELFLTDGFANGTRVLADLGGQSSSSPSSIALIHGKLFFAARTDLGEELQVLDHDGSVSRLGAGCSSGTHNAPVLDATSPRIAKNLWLRVRDGAKNALGVHLISSRSPDVGVFAGACEMRIRFPAFLEWPFVTDSTGRWSQLISIPADPSLIGVLTAVQSGVGNTGTYPLGTDLTNLLLLDIGK